MKSKTYLICTIFALIVLCGFAGTDLFAEEALSENFESYSLNGWPSPDWIKGANAQSDPENNKVVVDPCDVIDKVLKLHGSLGGCWAAIAYNQFDFPNEFIVEVDVYNGSESLSGCHPHRSKVAMKQGTNWTNPGRNLIRFRGNGEIALDERVFQTYITEKWYHIKIHYKRVAKNLTLRYWIDGTYKGEVQETIDDLSKERSLDHILLNAPEGSAYFDNLRIQRRMPSWNHRRFDMAGSCFYDYPSTSKAKADPTLDWSTEGTQHLLTGDVTGDGKLEVITSNDNGNSVRIYAKNGQLLQNISNSEYANERFFPSLIADYDGDGIKDIGIGTGKRGMGAELPECRSFFYNSEGTQLAQFDCEEADNKDSKMYPLAVTDKKVLTHQTTGYDGKPRGAVMYDKDTADLLWHYKFGIHGPIHSLAYEDGTLKWVKSGATHHNGGWGCGVNGNATCTTDGDLYTIAADASGNEIFTQDYFNNGNSNGKVDSHFIDIDQDGDLEVISFERHSNYYPGTGQIHILDGTTGAYLNTFNGSYNTNWSYVFGDLNSDGQIEIAATSDEPDGYTQYLLDHNLNVIANSNMTGVIKCACDIDGDEATELLMADGSKLRITDLNFNEEYSWDAENTITNIIVSDLDKNQAIEILLSTTSGRIKVLQSKSAVPDWSLAHITDLHLGQSARYVKVLGEALSDIRNEEDRKDLAAEIRGLLKSNFYKNIGTHIIDLAASVHKIGEKNPKPDFILVSGDVADYGCTTDSNCHGHYNDYLSIVKAFAVDEGIGVYTVPGNHDRVKPDLIYSCDCNLCCFFSEIDAALSDIPFDLPKSDFTYDYYFKHKGHYFIGLDSGGGFPKATGLELNQVSGVNQIDAEVPKTIFMHHPAVDINDGIFDKDLSIKEEFKKQFLDWCKNKNVQLVLSGHSHQNHIYDINENELSSTSSTRPLFIQTPSTSQKVEISELFDELPAPLGSDLELITSPLDDLIHDDPGYRIIHVRGNKLYPQNYEKLTYDLGTTKNMLYNVKTIIAALFSPANLHVYDSAGKHTGIISGGQVEQQIPDSLYLRHRELNSGTGVNLIVRPETTVIFDPCGTHIYDVIGNEKDSYTMRISYIGDGNSVVFEANNIPTIPDAVHQYIVDWNSLPEGEKSVYLFVDTDGDGTPERTVTSDSNLSPAEFDAPTNIDVLFPEDDIAVQDGITLTVEANDLDGIDSVYFCVREPNDGNGIPIGMEDLEATFNAGSDKWEYSFDTTQLPDGYYVVIAKAVDSYGNEGSSEVVPFSIRNWAVVELLPPSKRNQAGRMMPVKFSMRIAEAVDPAMPFVYKEDLEITIFKTAEPGNILQSALFGDSATDYRIDSADEIYITNFKTDKKPAEYTVEIRRTAGDFLVDSFTFETSRKNHKNK